MADVVRQFSKPMSAAGLASALRGESQPSEPLVTVIPLTAVANAIAATDGFSGPAIDGVLIEPLHRAMSGLTVREAADMRVWHWLTLHFRELIWRRWRDYLKQWEESEELSGEAVARFLGRNSLNGVSRNTFARLWWTAQQLQDDGDYTLARRAIENQDRFQAIFERRFGLYLPAAKACIECFSHLGEQETRDAARWLQQCLSTTVLERLSEEDIAKLLSERPTLAKPLRKASVPLIDSRR
jgi:hypothetical protein